MAVFEYKGVVIASGKAVKGVRDAENAKSLRAVLRREGVLLTNAAEDTKKKSGKAADTGEKKRGIDVLGFINRASTGDIAMMTRQLATLVRAGIPLVESIAALTEQLEQPDLQRIMTTVRERLNEGTHFHKALEAHADTFPPLYINMVAAGEASGTLEVVLERLADFMEAQARLRGKVSAALAYPILMTIVGSVLLGVLMVAVVPKVTQIFESMNQELPWYTQTLINISGFLSSYWWFVIICIVGGAFGFRRWHATEKGRLRWDQICLALPIFGKLFRMIAVARFSKTLATLLSSGVPLLKAMDIVKAVLDNAVLESVILQATGSIREGESIAEPLKRSGQFPPIVTHMITVGEKSGQLEHMLSTVADSYESQIEVKVQALTSLLEPIVILVMGGAVGTIAFCILMPLIQMNNFAN